MVCSNSFTNISSLEKLMPFISLNAPVRFLKLRLIMTSRFSKSVVRTNSIITFVSVKKFLTSACSTLGAEGSEYIIRLSFPRQKSTNFNTVVFPTLLPVVVVTLAVLSTIKFSPL